MKRFTVKSWVCDSGIYDNLLEIFIGKPFTSSQKAEKVCAYLNNSHDSVFLELTKGKNLDNSEKIKIMLNIKVNLVYKN